MREETFKNVEVSLNYGTTRTVAKDVIYIGTKNNSDGDKGSCISVTVEEAKWMIGALTDIVEEFEKEPTYKARKLLDLLNSGQTVGFDDIRKGLEEIIAGME
jgi:hypothetical protein